MSERARGVGFVLVAAMIWSTGGYGIKIVQTDALAISGFRSFFAVPVLLLWIAIGSQGQFGKAFNSLRRPYVWAAAFSYALTVTCFVMANKLTTAANTILLQSMAPIYVALLSWPLLREQVRPYDWLAIVGCLMGMSFFFLDKLSPAGMQGNLIAIVAGVGFAGLPLFLRLDQTTMIKKHGAHYSPYQSSLMVVTVGNVLAVLVALPWMISAPPKTGLGWMVLVGLGMIQIALAYMFYTAGVGRLMAVEASLLTLLEPILNPIWVALGTGEIPSRSAIIGGVMIIASVTARGVLQGMKIPVVNPK